MTHARPVEPHGHRWVREHDEVLYLVDYYGHQYDTMQRFKRRRPTSDQEQRHATETFASLLAINARRVLEHVDIVIPMPSSRADREPRLERCARCAWPSACITPAIRLRHAGYPAFHTATGPRPPPGYLEEQFALNARMLPRNATAALVLDDVIRSGAHWAAARNLLHNAGLHAYGLAIASSPYNTADHPAQ